MQIIIDISKELKNEIHNHGLFLCPNDKTALVNAIKHGTPLPKGHGELIERDKLEYLKAIHDAKYGHISWIDAIEKIKHSAPTIIEADKEN